MLRRTYEAKVSGPVAVTKAMLATLRRSVAGRIVNMPNRLGSFTLTNNLSWIFAYSDRVTYNSLKTTVNAIAAHFAQHLHDTLIEVNSSDPGSAAIELNYHTGTRSAGQGAWVVVCLAALSGAGPNGGFFDDRWER